MLPLTFLRLLLRSRCHHHSIVLLVLHCRSGPWYLPMLPNAQFIVLLCLVRRINRIAETFDSTFCAHNIFPVISSIPGVCLCIFSEYCFKFTIVIIVGWCSMMDSRFVVKIRIQLELNYFQILYWTRITKPRRAICYFFCCIFFLAFSEREGVVGRIFLVSKDVGDNVTATVIITIVTLVVIHYCMGCMRCVVVVICFFVHGRAPLILRRQPTVVRLWEGTQKVYEELLRSCCPCTHFLRDADRRRRISQPSNNNK